MKTAEPEVATRPFTEFLTDFPACLGAELRVRPGEEAWDFERRAGPGLLSSFSASGALSYFVPAEFGGGGAGPKEVLSILEAASYESLPLGLAVGINIGLFIQPLSKYGGAEAKGEVFSRFVGEGALGGLMLTEPDYGTDLLSMRTAFERRGKEYLLRGTKHWAGLSGRADFWLMSARERRADGSLKRDLDFFVCDSSLPGQEVVMEERYPNLGLQLLPYGRNRVDLRLPLGSRLGNPGSGVRLLLDTLHRSRMSFGGMAVGFLRRLLDEGLSRCRERRVGGRALIEYDQVERRLAEIQAAHTIASAFCRHAAARIALAEDLSGAGLAANVHKALLTDLMQESAQSLLQLSGAEGYRLDSLAGRAVVDSRPFQIFEGSNDVLYDQIAAAFLSETRVGGSCSLASRLGRHELGRGSAKLFEGILGFELSEGLSQRKAVDLGRIVARAFAASLLVGLGEAGYDASLVENAIAVILSEVAALASGLGPGREARVLAEEGRRAAWQDCTA
jgi:alkylation response protein AidB-like acyl-CoA dehydrogenase